MTMRVDISPGTRRQLIDADYGAWEDTGRPDEVPPADERGDPNGGYFVPILRRFKTRLEIRDRWEAVLAIQELEYFASSAGFCWWTKGFARACRRMAGEIREAFGLEGVEVGYSYDWTEEDEEWTRDEADAPAGGSTATAKAPATPNEERTMADTIEREKVDAGHYRLVTDSGELDVVKLADREWVVQLDLEEEDETVDLGTYQTLSAAEEAAMDSTTVSHWLDRAKAVLSGRPIDWEVEVDEDSDPVPVCWEKPSGHGVSAVHLTADGEETICGNRVRTDRPKVDPDEQDHACGHCFK